MKTEGKHKKKEKEFKKKFHMMTFLGYKKEGSMRLPSG
jgi:hypothetical protein